MSQVRCCLAQTAVARLLKFPESCTSGIALIGTWNLTKWEWLKLWLTAVAISIALCAVMGAVVWLAVEGPAALHGVSVHCWDRSNEQQVGNDCHGRQDSHNSRSFK